MIEDFRGRDQNDDRMTNMMALILHHVHSLVLHKKTSTAIGDRRQLLSEELRRLEGNMEAASMHTQPMEMRPMT